MIPRECRRLAEVDFPIAEVSRHAAREKSIRHGHPSTLHLWWARRPLASSRAMLMALLLPDPCDPHCPEAFKKETRQILLGMHGRPGGWIEAIEPDDGLRRVLLKFIADFANWNLAANGVRLETARALVRAAHGAEPPLVVDPFAGGGSIPLEALRVGCEAFASDLNPVACLILKVMLEDIPRHGSGLADELRKVGGEVRQAAERELADLYPVDLDGSTPIAYLWARTVRCEAPNCGAEVPLLRSLWLAKKAVFKREGGKRKKVRGRQALRYKKHLNNREIRDGFPHADTPIPVRPERSEAETKDALMPPVPIVQRFHKVVQPAKEPPRVELEIFEPETDKDVRAGTVTRAKATCLCCGAVLPPERVRAQLAEQRGGADVIFDEAGRRMGGACMTAVVTLKENEPGRHYRMPTDADYAAVYEAQARLAGILDEWERGGRQGLCPVPDEPISLNEIRRISVPIYGMTTWGDLFTARQKAALVELTKSSTKLPNNRDIQDGFPHPDRPIPVYPERSKAEPPVRPERSEVESSVRPERSEAKSKDALTPPVPIVQRFPTIDDMAKQPLALALTRTANAGCSLCRWHTSGEKHEGVYSRQALPLVWDYSESNPFSESTGGYDGALDWIANVIDSWPESNLGQVQPADAKAYPLPDAAASVWFTDPPYYDAVPYAHLSDFFFVWLKRALPEQMMALCHSIDSHDLTPKEEEIVVDRPHRLSSSTKTARTYESGMVRAFAEGRRILRQDGIGSVVFAHKTTEGWEALLSGMISGGWTITGSWPVATEMGSRLNARDTASLATSVHLVCRPRPDDAPVGDWADVLRELPIRVGEWMERLQGEGVRGADLVFACIGPALEIYSRYRQVETAEGREVGLPEYLERVWEVVGRTALENVLGAAEAKARNGMAGALEEDTRLTALFLWTLQSTGADDASEDDDNVAEDDDHEEADDAPRDKPRGYSLVFDVARRLAQPLGIELSKWEGRIIETDKGVVRLINATERGKQLFGEDGADTAAEWLERDPRVTVQQVLFPEMEAAPKKKRTRSRGGKVLIADDAEMQAPDATTLDRVHAAMLLQASGRSQALRNLLKAEHERGPDFLRLANALSALYPPVSEEKRLLDAMLLAAPR